MTARVRMINEYHHFQLYVGYLYDKTWERVTPNILWFHLLPTFRLFYSIQYTERPQSAFSITAHREKSAAVHKGLNHI